MATVLQDWTRNTWNLTLSAWIVSLFATFGALLIGEVMGRFIMFMREKLSQIILTDGFGLWSEFAAMTFRVASHIRKLAPMTLVVICVLLLNVNAIALAHIDMAGPPGATLESQSGHHDNGNGPLGHDSRQCNFGQNLSLCDSRSQILPFPRKTPSFNRSDDIFVRRFSSPPLRPPKP